LIKKFVKNIMSNHPELNQRNESIKGIELFCKSAALGSFTLAAQALGLTPAAVSRAVNRLETNLGAALFVRSTRKIALTEDGRAYFEVCQQALISLADAAQSIKGQRVKPEGDLRISVGSPYAHYRLLPNLAKFVAQYPAIRLQINISNRNIDFIDEGYDVAIRLGNPADSGLHARKLEDARIGVFASEAYLSKHKEPEGIEDLNHHALISFTLPSTGRTLAWLFKVKGKPIDHVPKASLTVSEDPLGCVGMAVAGMGLVQTFDWVATQQTPPLKEVLFKHGGCTRPIYALYASGKAKSAKLRVLLDFLAQLPRFNDHAIPGPTF
jgi:DNA-binding transcriptional LysR family regulator